jgi:DNA repair exonuclease SbcCD ATPase subunit
MRIQRVEIAGFGKLHDINLKLAPQTNVFFGENEAGKSTFQQAILAFLYGFYEGHRATRRENERWENYRPWQVTPYGGALEYTLDDGRTFLIERRFETDDIPTKVIDLATGRDITDDFGVGQHGNVPFAKLQLGMPRAVFVSSGFIDQGAVTLLEESRTIGDTLVSLADTGKRDISATKAIGNLDKFIKQRVGTERSRTTPLAIALRNLSEVQNELQAYQEANKSIQVTGAEKEELSRQLNDIKWEFQKVALSLVCKEIDDVEDRLERIKKQEQRMAEADTKRLNLRKYADFPSDLYEEAVKKRQSLSNACERLAKLQQRVNEKETELNEANLISDHQRLSPTIGQLSDSEYAKLQEIQEEVHRLAEKISEGRRDFEAMEARRILIKPWIIALMILLPPIGIPLFFWYRARAKRKLMKEKDGVRQAINLLMAEHTTISTRQETMLGRYEVKSVEELDRKRARYFQIGSSISEFMSLRNQVGDIELEVETERNRLFHIFEMAGIKEKDFDKASHLFDEANKGKVQYDQLLQEFTSSETQKYQILGKQTVGELLDIQKKLQRDSDTILANNPSLVGLRIEKALEELKEDHAKIDRQTKELENEILKRDERIRLGLSGYRDGAEIEEDVAQYEREVTILALFRRSLELAKEMIESAADEIHRDFAPQLAKAVGKSIATITGGRYTTVYVDPAALSITVREPTTGKTIPVERLSFGTEEQLYLLLRVELARLMSNLRERVPLFLDDVFVNFDHPRLMKALDFLASLSNENQIILFSKDIDVTEWFRSSLAGNPPHSLFIINADGSITAQRQKKAKQLTK